jgi:hypothetical protein
VGVDVFLLFDYLNTRLIHVELTQVVFLLQITPEVSRLMPSNERKVDQF